jgi:hypothetical protein
LQSSGADTRRASELHTLNLWHSNAESDGYSHGDSHTDSYADCDGYSHGDSHTDSYADCDGNGYIHPDADAYANVQPGGADLQLHGHDRLIPGRHHEPGHQLRRLFSSSPIPIPRQDLRHYLHHGPGWLER